MAKLQPRLKNYRPQRDFTYADASVGRNCLRYKGAVGRFRCCDVFLNVLFVTKYGDMRWHMGSAYLIENPYSGGKILGGRVFWRTLPIVLGVWRFSRVGT